MATPQRKKRTKPDLPAGTAGREAVFMAICEQLSHGGSLARACREVQGAPTPATVLTWVRDDPSYSKRYTDARAIGYLHLADELIEIADTPEEGTVVTTKEWGTETQRGDMIKHRTLRLDTRKWLLAKMLPKVFGEKMAVEHAASETLVSQMADIAKRLPV